MANHCDTIKLEKGMYQEAGRSFTQVLERLDPSEQYKGTGMEGLDAFQRQLKRFDIKVRGAASDPVEKFFRTADSAVLFPEYIARSVRQGMEEGDLLPSITAATTRFEGMDYRSITAQAGGDSKELKAVDEGASIPATTIQVQANLVKLRKRGRMLVASYEAVRYQKLDLFSVTLRQIGSHIAQMLLADAVEVTLQTDLRADCYVPASDDEVYQIAFNLMENAVKYNLPGGRVMVSLTRSEYTVTLEVADTGVGIPEEDRDKIFDRFYRVDKARSRAAGGTGLGLSIVSDTVRLFDGTIAVMPREGGGTRFIVTFPAYREQEVEV